MSAPKAEDVTRLALAFAKGVRNSIDCKGFAMIRKRNASPEYAGCCASHDFMDANMTMLEAFQLTFGRDPNISEDPDLSLWNAAWDKAKREQLTDA